MFGLISLSRLKLDRAVSALVLATAAAWAPAQASIYTEVGDAGQTQGTAQNTSSVVGTLTDIFGSLGDGPDADLFVINVSNPGSFSATTFNVTGGFLDTQLFLLTLAGAPVYFNDDDAGGLTGLSTLPAGNAFGPLATGLYILGVSATGYDPVNVVNQLLFSGGGLTTDVRGPASGLQPAVLGGFSDDTFFSSSGKYQIQLTGVGSVAAIPEPEIAWLLLFGGGLCAYTTKRRRRAGKATIPA